MRFVDLRKADILDFGNIGRVFLKRQIITRWGIPYPETILQGT